MESHTTIYGLIVGIYYPKATEGLYEMLCSALDQFWPLDVLSWAPKTSYINASAYHLRWNAAARNRSHSHCSLCSSCFDFTGHGRKKTKRRKGTIRLLLPNVLKQPLDWCQDWWTAKFPVMYFVLPRAAQAQPWNVYNRTAKTKNDITELGSISIYLSNQVHLRGQHHVRCQMWYTHNFL